MQIPHNLHYVVFIVSQKPYLYINDVLPPWDTVQKYQKHLSVLLIPKVNLYVNATIRFFPI